MPRELLGNIRGPRGFQGEQGEQGPEGDTGGFNGEMIGVNNLFNMSDVRGLNNVGRVNYDVTSGMLTYTGVTWNIRTTLRLNNTIHTLHFKDYHSNPTYSSGYIRLEVFDIESNNIVSQRNIFKDTPLTIDLSSMSEPQDVTLVMRVTTGDAYDGHISQPMLVEGEYTSGWQPSLKDLGLTPGSHIINSANKINNSINFQGETNTGNIVAEDGVNKYVGNTFVTVDLDGDIEANTVYTLSWDNEGLTEYNQIRLYDADGVFTNINYGSSLIERNIVENGRSYIVFKLNRNTPFENPGKLRIGTDKFTTHKSSMYCLNQSNNTTWQPSTQDLINHLG